MKKTNDIFIIKIVIIINFFSMFIALGAGCQGNKVSDLNSKSNPGQVLETTVTGK